MQRPARQCNPHKDKEGFPVDPPSRVVKETCRGISGQPPPQRVSYSGPLGDPSVRWTGTRSNLSSLSGLVASRTLGTDDDAHDHQVNKVSEICRERPRRQQQDHMLQSSRNLETGRASMKGPRMVSFLNSSTSSRSLF